MNTLYITVSSACLSLPGAFVYSQSNKKFPTASPTRRLVMMIGMTIMNAAKNTNVVSLKHREAMLYIYILNTFILY